MLHDGATVVGARVVVGACVATGALVVVVTRAVVGDGLEDWVSVAQLAMRKEITNGVAQRFMFPVFQTRYETNRGRLRVSIPGAPISLPRPCGSVTD